MQLMNMQDANTSLTVLEVVSMPGEEACFLVRRSEGDWDAYEELRSPHGFLGGYALASSRETVSVVSFPHQSMLYPKQIMALGLLTSLNLISEWTAIGDTRIQQYRRSNIHTTFAITDCMSLARIPYAWLCRMVAQGVLYNPLRGQQEGIGLYQDPHSSYQYVYWKGETFQQFHSFGEVLVQMRPKIAQWRWVSADLFTMAPFFEKALQEPVTSEKLAD